MIPRYILYLEPVISTAYMNASINNPLPPTPDMNLQIDILTHNNPTNNRKKSLPKYCVRLETVEKCPQHRTGCGEEYAESQRDAASEPSCIMKQNCSKIRHKAICFHAPIGYQSKDIASN